MTVVCGLDLETTGIDHAKDHVTEIAWVVKEIGRPKPLALASHFVSPPLGYDRPTYLSDEIQELTKITLQHVDSGLDLEEALLSLMADLNRFGVDYIVAHNGENFDRPFLRAKLRDLGDEVLSAALDQRPWVDTAFDCVYPASCKQTNLMYLCAYHGFVNPFPHAALFDTMAMLKVLDAQDFPSVALRSQSPWVFLKALVSYDERERAKARRFNWEKFGDRTFTKTWVKRIKECDLKGEMEGCRAAGFDTVQIA